MLKLTLEIFQHGDPNNAETLAEVLIINTLKNKRRPKFGDYRCEVFFPELGHTRKPRRISIKNHERTKGYWPLIVRLANHLEKTNAQKPK